MLYRNDYILFKKRLNMLKKYSNCKLSDFESMFNHFLMLCKKIKSNDINRTL